MTSAPTIGPFLVAVVLLILLVLVVITIFRPLPTLVWTLASIIFVVFVLFFLAAEIAATAHEQRLALTTYIVYPTLRLMGADPDCMEMPTYKAMVSTVLRTLLAINTIWFAVILPAGVVKRLRNELENKEVVQIKPIATRGEDDVQTLLGLLNRAHRVVMFAGGFDWLLEPETNTPKAKKLTDQLKGEISKMLGKGQITFVSNIRTSVQVRDLLRRCK